MMVFSRRTFMLGAAGTVATMASGNAEANNARCVIGQQRNRPHPQIWENHSQLSIAIQEIYAAALDDNIYLAGGLYSGDEGLGVSDRVFKWPDFDPLCDFEIWHELAALPEPRHHPNLVGHGDALYAFGGFRAGNGGAWNMLANTTRYDPASDSWDERAPMPLPYGETVAMSLGDHIHVATGRQPNASANANWNDHGDRGVHYVYDPASDSWDTAAPNPNPRNSAAGGVIDGRLHVVGGRMVNDGNRAHHEAYDPVEDRWHELAPLPQGQAGLCAAVHGGKLYAMGGEYFANGGGVYPECWIYDPQTDSWEAGPGMLTPRHGLGAVTIGDGIVIIGGATQAGGNGTSDLVEVLYPERI